MPDAQNHARSHTRTIKSSPRNLPLDKKILYLLLHNLAEPHKIPHMIKLHNKLHISKVDMKDKVRVGGPKGKTGSSDFTRGKCAFTRPCTVGWKSQNQPLMRGGGNRTPL